MDAIKYVDLGAQWLDQREDLLPLLERVLSSGKYIGGDQIKEFEEAAAGYFGVEYVVSLNSGTDALVLGLAALGVGPGDEVITPPNSFVASTSAITHLAAIPVFVDVLANQNISPEGIASAITKKTKAIMPVHLSGRMANMSSIMEMAESYGIPVIEDAAQAIGSKYDGRLSGIWGAIGCFSTHPLKNLNAVGDSGFIVTSDKEIAVQIKRMRNHGLINRDSVDTFGYVSRMDEIQASVLKYRLGCLHNVISKRRANAELYRAILSRQHVFHPLDTESEFNAWHTFVVQVDHRDELRDYLALRNIETAIHYPVPIHLQPAARIYGYKKGDFPVAEQQAGRILSLPIHQYLQGEEVTRIASTINEFYEI